MNCKIYNLKKINSIMNSELIRKLKEIDIIYCGDVKLKHAGASNFYVDVKKAYGYPYMLNFISDELWKKMISSERQPPRPSKRKETSLNKNAIICG